MEIQKATLSTACIQVTVLTSRQMEGKTGWLSLSLPLASDLGGPVLLWQGWTTAWIPGSLHGERPFWNVVWMLDE